MEKQREYLFDNLKALLIILVIFGHSIACYDLDGIFLKIKGMIYVFHMPLFILISGYFSKNVENIENKAINLLISFFIFNTIYVIYANRTLYVNIFEPVYLYWYLLSLFIWRITQKYLIKIKFVLLISFLLSIYIGLIDSANRFFSISRTICFLPYFILGYYINKEHIQKIRNISKKITLPILIILLILTYILSNDFIDIRLFENAQSYKTTNVTNLKGMLIRALNFFVAIIISICLINLMPSKKTCISNIGRKTITIYVLSPWLEVIFGRTINRFITINNNYLGLAICSISTILIVFICSRNIIYNTYNKLIDWIYKKITISEKLELSDKY